MYGRLEEKHGDVRLRWLALWAKEVNPLGSQRRKQRWAQSEVPLTRQRAHPDVDQQGRLHLQVSLVVRLYDEQHRQLGLQLGLRLGLQLTGYRLQLGGHEPVDCQGWCYR